MGEIARTLESSSLIQQYSLEEESHTSNSGNQYKNQRPLDLSTSEEFIRVAAAIQELVVSSRGQITLGQSFYNLNPLRTIGRGATFSVKALKNRNERLPLHRRIEPGFNELCDGVVYKRLRRFPVASFAERSRQLRMVMLELKALGHPPLVQHENIVKLKGVGFEPDFYGGEDPWPVLLVELADQETLADLQQNTTLSAELKFHLSLDVALGLQAVHNNSIVHGDVKTENVLLFTHDSRQYIAKIGDFGCSILGGNVADYLPRGTFPWQAPEILANQSLTFVDIIKCDMYVTPINLA